jgi:hypothetical protein
MDDWKAATGTSACLFSRILIRIAVVADTNLPDSWLCTSGIRVIAGASVGVEGTVILLQSAGIECGRNLAIRIPEAAGDTRHGSTVAAPTIRRIPKARKTDKSRPVRVNRAPVAPGVAGVSASDTPPAAPKVRRERRVVVRRAWQRPDTLNASRPGGPPTCLCTDAANHLRRALSRPCLLLSGSRHSFAIAA